MSLDLAALLDGYRDEIASSWVKLLYQMTDGSNPPRPARYTTRPITELTGHAREGLQAVADYFRRGSYAALEAYIDRISSERANQGFDVSELVQGFIALREAVMPVVWREVNFQRDDALTAASDLDELINWAVIRLSKIYASSLNALLARQVDRLKTSEEQLTLQNHELEEQRRELERTLKEISALNQSAGLLNSTLDLRQVLDLILVALSSVVSYDSARIMLFDDDTPAAARVVAAHGLPEPVIIGELIPTDSRPLLDELVSGPADFIIAELSAEESVTGKHCWWLGLPLAVKDERIGLLTINRLPPALQFEEREGRIVHTFANQAATAIMNARLYARSSAMAQLEERNRLSRELHDSVAQSLFSMTLMAQVAATVIAQGADMDAAHSKVTTLQETASAALQEMRSLIFELRPSRLEEVGLAAALKQHSVEVARRNGLEVNFCAEALPRLAPDVEVALFRIGQEALANVVKHARASRASVSIDADDNQVILMVEDNGVGITANRQRVALVVSGNGNGTPATRTLGLTSMRERAALLGGSVSIGPRRGESGTRVLARIPLAQLGAIWYNKSLERDRKAR